MVSTLEIAKQKIKSDLTSNKNRRLSALFRDIRKMSSTQLIGDWPIMSLIIQYASKLRTLSQNEISNMARNSKEYKVMSYGQRRLFTKTLFDSISY